ncbi:EAL domain-containing protein [Amphritea opalescens]|uniref:cyclic-guanylate-specific phosphodiesterase n=1 Tax=Amphritea opalescens TaxID=2490544 RepID=A0A430KVM6_9GAMM|nr:EAL domain-containing protein [Amphritea opalescens]RTE67561.1 EAL domain-containing protein [Amphritea opalescens]
MISKKTGPQADGASPEQLFKMAFNQQHQFLALISPEGRVLEINQMALNMQGAEREDYIGQLLWDAPAWKQLPEWKAIWQQRFQQAVSQRTAVITEDIYHIAGVPHYADAVTTALYASDDSRLLVGYIVQASDITERRLAENRDLAIQERLNFVLEQSRTGSWDLNLVDNTAYRSPQHDQIFGYNTPLPQWTYDMFIEHVIPEDRPDVEQKFQQAVETKGDWDFECRIKRHDGEIRWIWGSGSHQLDHSGRAVNMAGIVQDITKRKQFETDNQHYAAELNSLFQALPDIYFQISSDGTILNVHAHNQHELYREPSYFLGKTMQEVLPPKIGQLFEDKLAELERTHVMQVFTYALTIKGELRYYDARLNQMSIDHKLVCVVRDITDITRTEKELYHLAHHDALTGLPNRLLLNEYIDHAIKRAKRQNSLIAVIFFDLDNFKIINDSYGHIVGDLLLKETASRLLGCVREQDSVSRISGDEFILLLEDINYPDNLTQLIEKLLKTFQQEFVLADHTASVTASIGISLYPHDGQDSTELLRNADAAMYRAKNNGRNTYQFYEEDMTNSALEHIFFKTSLQQAIDKDEFHLNYQPQIRLHDNALIGMEVLIRWNHPSEGNIPPGKFIPFAEESNLIIQIGEWVLRTACFQAKKWLDSGIEFGRIAVNVAGPQIKRGNLVDTIKTVLAETGLPARYLEIEVTESYVMQDADRAVEQLNEIKALGITLAIDDFGTGYSSLSYLKKLPIHKLKIDGSFIRDIPVDTDDMAISKAVIALGASLGLTVIAEGVETAEQARFLSHAGCDEVQGYLYSRPIDTGAIEQYLTEPKNSLHPVHP